MLSLRIAVFPLRVLLGLTILALLGVQVGMLATLDEVHWVGVAAGELGLLCVQVVLVSTWRLLTLVQHDRVFSAVAIRRVDLIIAAIGIAWLLLAATFAYVAVTADDLAEVVGGLLVLLPASAFALLMVVMRALLVQATTLRTEMEAVI